MRLKHNINPVFHAQTPQSGQRQKRRIAGSGPQLVQTGLDIAPQQTEPQIRPNMQHLRLTPHGRTADQRSLGQTVIRPLRIHRHGPVPQDQRITRIFALERTRQHKPRRQVGFQILEAVDREIDPPGHQRLMDFLGKETLAPDFRQTLRLIAIALGADLVFLKRPHIAQNGAEPRQSREKVPRLDQRQRRRSRPDTKRELAAGRRLSGMGAADGFRGDSLERLGRQDGSVHERQL